MDIINGIALILGISIVMFGMSLGMVFMLRQILGYIRKSARSVPLIKKTYGGCPVMKLYSNDTCLRFLVDTGSNQSYITSFGRYYMNIAKTSKVNYKSHGLCGSIENDTMVEGFFVDEQGTSYYIKFIVNDAIAETFKEIEKEEKITIVGILGTDFLETFKMNVDFADCHEFVDYECREISKKAN